MKISFTISASQPKSIFFNQIKKMKEFGYGGIDLAIRDPKELDKKEIYKLFTNLKLEIPSITTGQAFSKDELSFTSPKIDIRKKAIQRIKEQIDFASNFKAKVLIGWIRGNWREFKNVFRARELFIDAMKACSKFAKQKSIQLVIEPINRYEIDSLHTIEETISLIRESNLNNVGIAIDLFHMNIEEVSITKSILRCAKGGLLSYIHVADSNRLAPGRGHLNFNEIFNTILKVRYKDFLSVEIFPTKENFYKEAKFAINYLRKVVK